MAEPYQCRQVADAIAAERRAGQSSISERQHSKLPLPSLSGPGNDTSLVLL